MNWLKYFFEFQYRFSKPRWDTDVTPPEVVETIERGNIKAGRALDLGCGTGTNAIYLARAGFLVVGVDFSPQAIAAARDKAHRAKVTVDFHAGDVTRLDSLPIRESFDYVLDIGCFHSVEPSRWQTYANGIAALIQPGALFMLYAFGPRKTMLRKLGATPDEIKQTFAENFLLERVEAGTERGEFSSAWYWFKKK